MSFTKGPWMFFDRGTKQTTFDIRAIDDSGFGPVVASVPVVLGEEARAANARLISAAPDLYEALQELLEQVNKLGVITLNLTVIDVARAALRKATP